MDWRGTLAAAVIPPAKPNHMKNESLSYYYRRTKIYLRVARLDHWFKNISVLVGIIAAIAYSKVSIETPLLLKSCLAIFLACLMSSANYVINEIVDAQFDKEHPDKKFRPVASGNVSVKKLTFFDAFLIILTLVVSYLVFNEKFFLSMILFFIIGGVFYNLPPIRTKDVPYIDVIAESANNPLRLMIGWYVINNESGPPLMGILCYWSLGAILVTAKRLAEFRFLGKNSIQYRPTFKYYDNSLLAVMYFFYIATTLVTFVLISLEYKHQMFYFLPFILIFFIWFTFLTFQQDSVVKEPERLFEKKAFVTYSLLVLFIFCGALFL
ncbi:MAG: UbiA family prenyltransferase [Candidatus Dadabacteria bacterium]|nr:UbiA family prenyltransferase [Candidatus Dadabacteria bacterium]